jgi:hypothetical protein
MYQNAQLNVPSSMMYHLSDPTTPVGSWPEVVGGGQMWYFYYNFIGILNFSNRINQF